MTTKAEAKAKPTATEIDLETAAKFLELLGAEKATFQWYPDKQDGPLPGNISGTLADHAEKLCDLNRAGAAVTISLNETDLKGAKRENIVEVRALFADLDDAPLDPVRACTLKPHIIVESSPGRHHVYWLVKGLPLDEYEDVQRGVAAAFDGDPAVALLTTRARVPGFMHNKAEPFQVRLVDWGAHEPFTADEVLAEWPPRPQPHKAPKSLAGRVVLPKNSPGDAAKEFLQRHFLEGDHWTLLFYRGNFYTWRGYRYKARDRRAVRSLLYDFLHMALARDEKGNIGPFNPTKMKVDQILDVLESEVYLDTEKQAPFWVPPSEEEATPAAYLAFRNGVLDLDTRTLRPHSPGFFCVNVVPFDYEPEAASPKQWRKFLEELWPGEDHKRTRLTLQEVFGWLLAGDCSFHKIGLLAGPKRSGKTTISRVLEQLVGTENVVSPRLSNLANHFGMACLIDKKLAIIQDARLGPRTDVHAVTENLLSISGQGKQGIPQKYRDDWSGHLSVQFLIISNELPRIADASGTVASRYIPLLTTRSFEGKEDLTLIDKLLPELPSIANWALRGWDRLHERGHFVLPEASREVIRQMEDLASPVAAFVRDCCEVGINRKVEKKELFSAWRAWCEEQGHKPGASDLFGRNLRAAYPEVRPSREGRGERRRYYLGIELTKEAKDELNDDPEPGSRG